MNKNQKIEIAVNEIICNGNLDLIPEIFADQYTAYASGKKMKGLALLKQHITTIRAALPDIRLLSVKFINQGNKTVTRRRTYAGTHTNNLTGIPATGAMIIWEEMVVSRFEEHRIREEWIVSDLVGQLLLKNSQITLPEESEHLSYPQDEQSTTA